ncbi:MULTISPECIES: alpha/beta hydrolase family protein [unclassified Variovorax]|uniref:alpha/beta hydrolase n=1 Tax=unclassified Variovorax TaxID=663243 RepID=UPI0008C7CEEF|nr:MULTISPECIES: alpha/beta hydrolase family protein [unclassified Variovorax]SEJ59874.1 Pimeloyl-ACP methyl ester carboxylesterase [Variovorax sp. OK202]SFC66178.1 Pimeloyl-ACP methyl ester carboxylesterase [Variovorax sp. OK212]
MKRRNLFARAAGAAGVMGLAATGLVPARAAGPARANPPSTFVLVHGAWHGGWCWSRVASRLCAAGHAVFTPTLTGLGERRHLISPQVNLDTHIDDIVNLLQFEELERVVLVGHSYAGIVISGVADRAAAHLRQLVYLDSLLLEPGKSLFSDFPPAVVEQRLKAIRDTGGGVGAAAALPPAAFGVKDPADAAWVARRLTPQPVGTYLQPLLLKAPLGNGLPRTYIECTGDPIATLEPTKARVRADAGWQLRTLATGHDAMVTAPGPLADLLAELAAPTSSASPSSSFSSSSSSS